MAGKGDADTRTPNIQARREGWERIWGKNKERQENQQPDKPAGESIEEPEQKLHTVGAAQITLK